MSSRNKPRSLRQPTSRALSKALLLPMSRSKAPSLALRTRIAHERRRNGEAGRALISHMSQIVFITGYITRTGFGRLDVDDIDRIERTLDEVLLNAGRTGEWRLPDSLIRELTTVVNEYDRQLATTRVEIVARASEHLERRMVQAARQPGGAMDGGPAHAGAA
ncbi:hypothetical protein C7401_12263 [Paraburkholderia unamae]|uniref:hypothetical protein n=1 Tax=Paraburkholderia unamae TaxID=219649 RepID=UPI000DC26537|nr:hypothetical protein [Paraburkholderia unamae]RAR55279.1 hypothetical protein C7401_12263 [Paraburkholderia unamae]